MTVSDPSTALARLRSHVECLKIHIKDAHDALSGCAVELVALADSGHIQLHTNCECSHALLFQVAESAPLQELALVAFKLGAEMDDEVLGAVIQLHTGLAALKGVIDA